MKEFNRTDFELKDIEMCRVLKVVRSNWRSRYITLYQHPLVRDRVFSVGITFNGEKTIVAEETKEEWSKELSSKGHFVETF